MCTKWHCFTSCGAAWRTTAFKDSAPKLPPVASTSGTSAAAPTRSRPNAGSPSRSSGRTGEPQWMSFPRSRGGRSIGKLVPRTLRKGMARRLARPGEESDSWATTGIRRSHPANTTGKLTKPPLEKITSGRNRPSRR